MLPDHAGGTLSRAADDLGVALTAQQHRDLLGHLALLAKWNKTYNLTAVRDIGDMLHQHLIDSLAVVPVLKRHLDTLPTAAGAHRVLDVGSGAGLPGVVLAITLPSVQVCCVDTVGKKASFIRQVAAELSLANLHAEHARVEAMPSAQAQVVTSRAFASLADFVSLTSHHLAAGGVWMAMKGKTPTGELAALPDTARVFHVEPLTVPGLNAERCLVWMSPTKSPH